MVCEYYVISRSNILADLTFGVQSGRDTASLVTNNFTIMTTDQFYALGYEYVRIVSLTDYASCEVDTYSNDGSISYKLGQSTTTALLSDTSRFGLGTFNNGSCDFTVTMSVSPFE